MNEEDLQFIKQTEAWIKTQMIVIESCDLNIDFYSKQIELLTRNIKAEQEEKEEKIRVLHLVKQRLEKFKADNADS
jgi:hypothetical protein